MGSRGNSVGRCPSRVVARFPSRVADLSPSRAVDRCQSRAAEAFLSRVASRCQGNSAETFLASSAGRCRSRSADRYRDSLARTFARTSSGAKSATTAKTQTLPDQKDQENTDIALQIKNYNCQLLQNIFSFKTLHPT